MHFDLEIGTPHVIRASSTLTSSYVAGSVIPLANHNAIALEIIYTKGDETTMELKVETSLDGTNYYQNVSESTSTGTTTVSANQRQFGATMTVAILLTPLRAKLVKVSVKATGGTPTGTCAIKGTPLWV